MTDGSTLPRDFAPERLLAHAAWVRRLAGRLLVSEADADDVAQQSLLVALEEQPREPTKARSWLAAIARNLARRMRRGDARRSARERAAARGEALPSGGDLVARAELQRAVVDAVLALPEPYRGTVLLRFFEELPASEIARRRGEPVETVRTRLKRGLAQLRERLGGTRLEALVALLEPAGLAATASGVAAAGVAGTAATGAIAMTLNAKVVAIVVLVAAGAWTVWELRQVDAPAPEGLLSAAAGGVDRPDESRAAAGEIAITRSVVDLVDAVDHEGGGRGSDGAGASSSDSGAKHSSWLAKLRAELTLNNHEQLHVGDDLGPETRAAFDGLANGTLELDPLLAYVLERLDEAWIVPGTHFSNVMNGERSDRWHIAYANSSGGASIARIDARRSDQRDYVRFELRVNQWGKDVDPHLELEPWITFSLHRDDPANRSVVSGQLGLYQNLSDRVPTEKIEELGRSFRYLTMAWVNTAAKEPRLTYARTKAGRALSVSEVTRLEALFERFMIAAAQLAEQPRTIEQR